MGADNEQAVNNLSFRTEDLLTDLFRDKDDFRRGITTVTDEEIQARNLWVQISYTCCFIYHE